MASPTTRRNELDEAAKRMALWDYRPFIASPYAALDTETEVVDLSRKIPRLVLATVSNGQSHLVIRPEQLGRFVVENLQWAQVVMWNARFDWWVIHQHLKEAGEDRALQVWEDLAEHGRIRDGKLLDFLIRLAEDASDGPLVMRSLKDTSRVRLGWILEKDKYREDFASLIGQDWKTVDPGFFQYAVKDAIATWALWHKMEGEAAKLAYQAGVSYSTQSKYGRLTEKLQVKADLVLAQAGRNGMYLDRGKIDGVRERLKATIAEKLAYLRTQAPGLFHEYVEKKRAGQLKLHAKTGTPLMDTNILRSMLFRIAGKRGVEQLPKTAKTGELQTGLDLWKSIAGDDPFVASWAELMETSKLLQFVVKLEGESVHPQYEVLVRTGRTSAKAPNIQQMPREPWFRELFQARPGHKLVIVDYSAIELRTLAAVLMEKYGKSQLAEVLKQKVDPHAYTAAMVLGMTYEEFLGLKKGTEEQQAVYKKNRQAAKAINFGVPGGLGATKLAAYAKANYGVDMAPEQAGQLRQDLITKVYPELATYLEEDTVGILAGHLQVSPESVVAAFANPEGWFWKMIQNVLSGRPFRVDGAPYKTGMVNRVWETLAKINQNPTFQWDLNSKTPSPRLSRALFSTVTTTLTGRPRKGTNYTEARNTPFQALAADGAKEALWRLFRAGYRIVAFIHDEVVIEHPAASVELVKPDIERIMIEAMEETIGHGIPVEVEGHISEAWTK